MSVIEVAVPMRRSRRRFHVEKGRRWSVIEHLMLEAVSRAPATTADLSKRSNLHRRIVVEAFIRLMRAGWVEILDDPRATIFRATTAGKEQIRLGELKGLTTIRSRTMSFAFERVTGQAFRGSEFSIRARQRISKSTDADALVFLSPDPRKDAEDLSQIYSALEGENEVIVGSDSSPHLPIEGFAVVRVLGGVIDDISSRAEEPLRRAILQAAAAAATPHVKTTGGAEPTMVQATDWSEPVIDAVFDHNDLIVGEKEHKAIFLEAFSRARERVVVHSTFLSDRQDDFLKPILAAAARNVRVDILWGQSDDATENSASREAASLLRQAVQQSGRSDLVKIHSLTTDSHAKIIASDDGSGAWSALVGSCNWLSTEFDSFEATVRLRDPRLAGRVVNHLATMSLGSRGVWHSLADELTVLARRIVHTKSLTGRKAKVRILLSSDHASLPLEARDRARKRILITSHRIGVAGLPMAIVPAVTAAQEKKIEAALFYGRATGPLSGTDAAELTREFERQGVRIRPIFQPRLHAKALCWDDDALAISSQNWLSASSSQAYPRREIGVFVELNKIADTFVRRLEHARSQFM
ncbi:phospholipase D-like domain-containing protein [uncultured Bradyrhizobium sp.]|uniref:phospholipase D-like domain-containing protein n=1 Tax=uncultured Bradyrhizobium sp. TaxID=199684 RepID=UPI0035CB584D